MDVRSAIKDKLGNKIIDWQEKSTRRSYFSIKKEHILETVKLLFHTLGLRFSIASATDMPEGLEILYHFSFDAAGEFYSVRVIIPDKAHPEVDSITPLFPGAEWIEREMWELLGINFKGHPNLKRLLLSEDWPEGEYPLRHKDES
ncbi:MAG: NADH-quinone oxidoreductase subunit C [Candidatus Omnitrophica bacterium]|nr:NADH-quinone oxidoreductase subunit C [Candidatus Omnitrophota bacterium]